MNKRWLGPLLFLIVSIAGFILAILVSDAYRVGQIDALTGKVKYHLVVKPDSTRVWEKIDE